MLDAIQVELARLDARNATVRTDESFEPETGPLVQIMIDGADWHLLPEHLLALLRSLPDAAGPQAVHRTIETDGQAVWHGPAPPESRDTVL
jgi:hypothetical protein